jgi:hypothetical protein
MVPIVPETVPARIQEWPKLPQFQPTVANARASYAAEIIRLSTTYELSWLFRKQQVAGSNPARGSVLTEFLA